MTEHSKEIIEGINFGEGTEYPQGEEELAPAETPPEEPRKAPEEPPERKEAEPPDTEEKARQLGWRPKEEWKGDPDKWVSAEEFVEKGEQLLPVMKRDRERLFGEVKELKQQLQDVLTYHKEDRERMQKRMREEYARELADLKAKQRMAVEEGDTAAFDDLEKQKEDLEQKRPEVMPPTPAGAEGTQPASFDKKMFEDWQKQNTWYQTGGTDGYQPLNDMTRAAQLISFRVQAENPHLSGWEKEFLDKVTEGVKLAYPDKFGNPRRGGVSNVESGVGTGGTPSRKKTFADLPLEAQVECRRMEKAGMKESEYVAEYFGLEGVQLGD